MTEPNESKTAEGERNAKGVGSTDWFGGEGNWWPWSGAALGEYVLPINIKVGSPEEAEHVCKAHNRILEEMRVEMKQVLRQLDGAQRAFNACMNGELKPPNAAICREGGQANEK